MAELDSDQPDREEFLTVAEVAEWLKLNPQTVRNWIDRGELRAFRVGARRVRVKRSDLEAFIAAGSTAGGSEALDRLSTVANEALASDPEENPDEAAAKLKQLAETAEEVAADLQSD